jgi:hypothetical protein
MMENFSFKKGYQLVQQKDAKEVRQRIMSALNLTSRRSWGLRLNGLIEPKVSEAQTIESIFNEYDIYDIWGS